MSVRIAVAYHVRERASSFGDREPITARRRSAPRRSRYATTHVRSAVPQQVAFETLRMITDASPLSNPASASTRPAPMSRDPRNERTLLANAEVEASEALHNQDPM